MKSLKRRHDPSTGTRIGGRGLGLVYGEPGWMVGSFFEDLLYSQGIQLGYVGGRRFRGGRRRIQK